MLMLRPSLIILQLSTSFQGDEGEIFLLVLDRGLTYVTKHETQFRSQGIDLTSDTLEQLDEIYRLHDSVEVRAVTHASITV